MPRPNLADESIRVVLLELLDRCYERQSWHGPNLKGSIRGLTADQAAWRPGPGRHAIAEIVAHAAYWKYTVRRRLLGLARGSFTLKGSNWFALPEPFTAAEWSKYRALLNSEHVSLRTAVAEFPAARWHEHPAGSKFSFLDTNIGIAQHDVYHAGQIQILKRLLGAAGTESGES